MMVSTAPRSIGNIEWCRNTVLLPDSATAAIPAVELLSSALIDDCMSRFGRQYPEGNPRAVASAWVKSYCLTLLPAVVLTNLLSDHALTLSLDRIGFIVGDDGVPAQIVVPDNGWSCAGESTFVRFGELVHGHLEPMFVLLEKRTRLSRKIMWGQASFLLGWVLGVSAGHELRTKNPDLCDGMDLIRASHWPDGSLNPLFEPTRPVPIEGGIRHEKRVCCLSHQLEANGGLCMGCPHHRKRAVSCLKTAA